MLVVGGCANGVDSEPPLGGGAGATSGGASTSIGGGVSFAGSATAGQAGAATVDVAGGRSGSPTMGGGGGSMTAGGGGGAGGAAGGTGNGVAGANFGGSAMDPGTEGDGDFTVGPSYSQAPESRVNASTPKGTVRQFTMSSATSAIYPVNVKDNQPFTRKVQVYTPNGYVSHTEVPFMVSQDGERHKAQIIPVVDNLIASKKLPAMVIILIEPGPGDGTGSQRSNEYDKVSDKYSTFIETEVLPKVQADYDIKLTTNPEGRGAFGGSSGGPAAFGMAWFRPDLYRRILTYSGSFVNLARDEMYPNGAWDYHEKLIPNSPAKPIRVAISCGETDNGYDSSESSHRSWVFGNQNMAKALRAKGYHYHFTFAKNSGHDADALIKQTLPEIMLWLWRGYVAPP